MLYQSLSAIYACLLNLLLEFYETVAMQIMKREQSHLSREAHECVEGIPELYKMVDGVQALGEFILYLYSPEDGILKRKFDELILLSKNSFTV